MGIFTILFYQPIYNLLIWFSEIIPGGDIGWSIIALTLLIKAALFPLTYKSLKAQREMQELQPKIAEVKEKYKEDQKQMAEELMKIYKEHNVNPFGSCLPLLIQLPIFLAIFRVLQRDLHEIDTEMLYSFIPAPEAINTMFLGIIDLATISIPLAIITAIAQYLQVKSTMMPKPAKEVRKSSGALDEDVTASIQKFTMYFIPGLTLIIGSTSLPAGVMLYWLMATIITVIVYRYFAPKKKEEPEIEVLKN